VIPRRSNVPVVLRTSISSSLCPLSSFTPSPFNAALQSAARHPSFRRSAAFTPPPFTSALHSSTLHSRPLLLHPSLPPFTSPPFTLLSAAHRPSLPHPSPLHFNPAPLTPPFTAPPFTLHSAARHVSHLHPSHFHLVETVFRRNWITCLRHRAWSLYALKVIRTKNSLSIYRAGNPQTHPVEYMQTHIFMLTVKSQTMISTHP
jgi:hypothetical protein